MSYQKKDGHGHTRPSFFGMTTTKTLRTVFSWLASYKPWNRSQASSKVNYLKGITLEYPEAVQKCTQFSPVRLHLITFYNGLHNLHIFWLIRLISLISTLLSSLISTPVEIIQPFICRVAYIQPYCVSECIDIGHTKLTFQPYYASKMLAEPYFNPMIWQNTYLLTVLTL